MPTIISSEAPLNVRADGDDRRPALILINPLGTTLEVWDPLLDRLLEHNYVVRLDLRGHGLSELPDSDEPLTLGGLCDDVLAVMDALELSRAHLVGASLGGLVAASLAADHPERVDRLVLIATAPHLGPDYWWQRTMATVEAEGLEGVADHVHEILFSPEWIEASPDASARARQMFLETPSDAYLAGAGVILDTDLREPLKRIRSSTLLVVGENDPVLRHYPAEDVLAEVPDAEAVIVGGARHRVFLEQPDAVASVICQFLTDPDAR